MMGQDESGSQMTFFLGRPPSLPLRLEAATLAGEVERPPTEPPFEPKCWARSWSGMDFLQ